MNTLDEKLKTVSNNVPKVYNAGYSKGEVEGYDKGVVALIEQTITEVTSEANVIRQYIFESCKALTSVNFPNATEIKTGAFRYCSKLTSVNFPNVTKIGTYCCDGCDTLTSVDFPNVTSISMSAFANCTKLTSVNFPNVTKIDQSAFSGCNKLTSVDFPNVTSIGYSSFKNCFRLAVVILRSETLCALINKAAFDNCFHFYGTVNAYHNPNGDKDGYFYVPKALVDSYKAATNWSTYASQFRALEDYTVDGTITGKLDETKI